MIASFRKLLATILVVAPAAGAQTLPRTAAERSNFDSTSTSAQVGAFLDSLQLAGAPLAISEMGRSVYGKPIYLAIVSEPAVTSAAEAAASGKLVVYLQGNIHAGEVEGKEAALILLRELATTRRDLLQQLVILAAPDYNPDGNDAFGPVAVNRAEQSGPVVVGERADGLNLDLNRDYFKAEAPETRASLARVFGTWDPALLVDLHTTDGTRHGYLLTYAPPLEPAGPAGPTAYVRDQMLPALQRTLESRYHEPIFVYGDVEDPLQPASWDTYAPLGWYGTNYAGLRGRMAILSEAYSHAAFKTRVQVTHDFLAEILAWAAAHADEIRRIERRPVRDDLARHGAGGARGAAAHGRHHAPRPAAARADGPVPHGPHPDPRPVRGFGQPAVARGLLRAGRCGRRAAAPEVARHPGPAARHRLDRHGRDGRHRAAHLAVAPVSGTPPAGRDGDLRAHGPHGPGGQLFRPDGAAAGPAGVRAPRAGGVGARAVGDARPAPWHRVRHVLGADLWIGGRAGIPAVARPQGAPGPDAGVRRRAVRRQRCILLS
jgi:hypothetical protein